MHGSGRRTFLAATPDPAPAPAPAPAPTTPDRARLALVIGIDTYAPTHPDLTNARNDAVVVAQHLRDDFGFTVTTLLDREATVDAIWAVLDTWRDTLHPSDDVLVFFAGHGATAVSRRPRGYLVTAEAAAPADAAAADTTPTAAASPSRRGPVIPPTWLAEDDLIESARALPAQRVLLILDACYAGTALRLSDALLDGERHDQVIRILVAGTERQPVLDVGGGQHSVFTRALLDGLDGLADSGQRPDGTVTARELITFVCAEVPWRSRVRLGPGVPAQTPVGGTIQARPDDADFTFVPTRPRLPTTILRNLYSPEPADREAAARQLAGLRGLPTAPLAAAELVRLLRGWAPGGRMAATDEPVGGAAATGEGAGTAAATGEPAGGAAAEPAESTAVVAAAACSLGALGEPAGFAPLLLLATGAEAAPSAARSGAAPTSPGEPSPTSPGEPSPTSPGEPSPTSPSEPSPTGAVRVAATEALGRLVATSAATHPGEAEEERAAAVETLIGLLGADPALREAAKAGLGHVPAAAPILAARLTAKTPAATRLTAKTPAATRLTGRAAAAHLTAKTPHPPTTPHPARTDLADALAVVGQRHVHDDVAWPRLPTLPAWQRRWHLARRRLSPRLAAILGDAGVVGAGAAAALALAYFGITMVAFTPQHARAFAPGAISVGALPGLVAGVSLFGLPRVTSAASRFQSLRSGAVGGLLAGLVVAAALWVPNWYLGIGCPLSEGCPPNAEWLWLVPGLAVGLPLGLIAGTVLPAPGWPHGRRWGAPLQVAVCVAAFAGVRMAWPALLTQRTDNVRLEIGMWALGGLVFGLALALLWPTTAETSAAGGAEGWGAASGGSAPAGAERNDEGGP